MKFLICCLGNIGPEYQLTRHNIGFLVADRLAEKLSCSFTSDRHTFHAEGKFKGKTIHIIKPTTYMNLSGKAVSYWMKTLHLSPEQILVITDDIALPFGKLRMRSKGSAGGHNGLTNIQEMLGTDAYPRLRFGVGNDFPKGRQADYVLSNFPKEEIDLLPELMDKCIDGIFAFCTIGIEKAMNGVNAK
ncbi:MAG: aminoacyl-tRNA hydrolase [Cytophagaceae bacterium]